MPRSLTATLLLAGTLALSACSSDAPRDQSGQVTASASADAASIRVGDCVGKLTTGNITAADLLPCGDKHFFEAYASKNAADGAFPGNDPVSQDADSFCGTEFASFVGVPVDKSKYTFYYLTPTEESWKQGDRVILCFAGDDKGGVVGTLKGAKK